MTVGSNILLLYSNRPDRSAVTLADLTCLVGRPEILCNGMARSEASQRLIVVETTRFKLDLMPSTTMAAAPTSPMK